MIAAEKRHSAIWEHALLPSYRKSLRDVTLKACVGVRRTFPAHASHGPLRLS